MASSPAPTHTGSGPGKANFVISGAVEGAAGVTTDVAETCEKGVKQWNVFVSNDAHGELPEVAAV